MELKTWLDRSQKEISNNKGKCFKKEKEARYFHDNVSITTNSALLWSYARTEQYCVKCLRDTCTYWKFYVPQYVVEDGKLDWT